MKNEELKNIYQDLKNLYPEQKEYLSVVDELLESVDSLNDESIINNIKFKELFRPNEILKFEVEWYDDNHLKHINNGYRVKYNNNLGPYKGGLRFHKNVNESVLKALSFEQTFKNSLTGLPMGGAKGGSDFDPNDKSENEIKNFCSAFMQQLYPYIGAFYDVPAGDLGVRAREIKYLLEEYLKHKDDIGALTGKPIELGGLKGRSEATGYGLCYFTDELLKDHQMSFVGKRVIISGIGNVSTYTCKKAIELGAKVIGMSDSKGCIIDEKGIDAEIIEKMYLNKQHAIDYLKYKPETKYIINPKNLWKVKCDIALPCAIQNEIDLDDVKTLVNNGMQVLCEGANFPSTKEAINYMLENNILYGPAKASNAGGVTCSYFEMLQNRDNEEWSFEKTDHELKNVMVNIYHNISNISKKYNQENNLLFGANIFGLLRVINN